MYLELIPVLAVIGSSGSGKTTLLEYLITKLSDKKIKVAVIKHTHHRYTIDPPGKDTWKFIQAGAPLVAAVSPENIVIMKMKNTEITLENIVNIFHDENPELILLEGFHSLVAKNTRVYKIVSAQNIEDLFQTLAGTTDPIIAITGLITQSQSSIPGLEIPLVKINDLITRVMDIIYEREDT